MAGWAIGAHGFEPIYQCLSLWPLRNCSSSRAVTAREIAATEGAAARKMMSSALQHVETAKASHARIVLMTYTLRTSLKNQTWTTAIIEWVWPVSKETQIDYLASQCIEL